MQPNPLLEWIYKKIIDNSNNMEPPFFISDWDFDKYQLNKPQKIIDAAFENAKNNVYTYFLADEPNVECRQKILSC